MKNSTPDFSPFTPRQLDLLEKIKAGRDKIETLSKSVLESGVGAPELAKTLNERDRHTVSLIRSGAIKRGPDKLFSFPPQARAWAKKKGLDKPQIQHYYHPQLPTWAIKHLEEWIQHQCLRKEGRETLRKTKVVGLETGMKRPVDMTLLVRVLELRGFEIEDGPLAAAIANEPPVDTLAEMLERSRRVVTNEMLENARRQGKAKEKKRTRTRKERGSWDWVIKKLVEEGLLPKEISHQALKERLKTSYPEWPWDQI